MADRRIVVQFPKDWKRILSSPDRLWGTKGDSGSLNTEGSFPNKKSGWDVKLKIHINIVLRATMRGVKLQIYGVFRDKFTITFSVSV